VTKLNPNSLQAFLLKKKEQNQSTLVPQSQPVSKPQLTAPPPEESIAEVNTGESIVVEESKAEEMTGVVTNVIESEAVGNHAEMQEPPKMLSTPKPVKVSNVLNRDVLRAKANEMTLEDVSQMTGDERDAGVTESEFKQVLDILDQKMMQDKGIVDDLNLADFRSIISRIMIDLKANPSYAGLMLDKHVHSIMSFMWATQAKAVENNIKKEGAAQKRAVSTGKKSALALAFNKVSANDLSL
jgi:hypothetical protein